ncbi:MAG: hypothetical protein CXZ00_03130 [Acidobacteria bacterium]|nr:MAG: hypothetical protein CXZ00_03130 [Acidobacteriota bacterium]
MRPAPARDRSLRIPLGPNAERSTRIDFISTKTPGIVITPASDKLGRFSFHFGCNLTHAPSGCLIVGPFSELALARSIAHILGAVMDWDGRLLCDPKMAVAALQSATRQTPELYAWIESLQNWGEQ